MTRTGRGVLAAGAALLGVGWLIDNRMWMSTGITALAFVAMVRVALGRTPPVTLAVNYPAREVRAGDEACLRLTMTMQKRALLSKRVDIALGNLTSAHVDLRQVDVAVTRALTVPTRRRGLVRVPDIRLSYGDPWSIFRSNVASADGIEILVYPRTRAVHVPDPEGRLDAAKPSSARGEDEFFALREYVLGDEPRQIHWRSTARLGQLLVRQQVVTAGTTIAVLLENSRIAYADDEGASRDDVFEHAVEQTVGVIEELARRRVPFALLTTDASVVQTHTDGQSLEPVLRSLALVGMSPTLQLDCTNALRRLQVSTVLVVAPTGGSVGERLPRAISVLAVEDAEREQVVT